MKSKIGIINRPIAFCSMHRALCVCSFLFLSLCISTVQAQFPFIQRKIWDGPYDIKMIAAPNLDPVFVNPAGAAAGNLRADSLITSGIMQRTGDLMEINNRYKDGSPFQQYSIPRSAFQCKGNPNTGGCLSGLTLNSPTGPCPTRYSDPDYVTSYVSMSYADYDNDLTTYSSSMARLDISSCSEIEAAYLYWTGMFKGSNDNITLLDGPLNSFNGVNAATVFNTSTTSGHNSVKFKIPGSTVYQTVTATAANTRNATNRYLCVADVTALVQGTGGGDFWVANLQSYPIENGGGSASGWTLVVVFRSPLSPPRLISLWDGLINIDAGDEEQLQLTGLTTPATSNFKSYVGFGALDGENLATQISTPEGLGFQTNNGGTLYNINPFETDQPPYKLYTEKGYPAKCGGSQNIDACKKPLYDANWCSVYDGVSSSHITSYNEATNKNGNEITRLPANINTLGFDAHHMKLPDGSVAPGATTATISVKAGSQGSTNPFLAYIAIERLQPKLEMIKTANKATTATGTTITYTLRIRNKGNAPSLGGASPNGDKVFDTLDIATDYVAGSLTSKRYVNGTMTAPAPGVTLVSSAANRLEFNLASAIQPGDSVDLIFNVLVKHYASNVNLYDVQCKRSILNTAYVRYKTISSGVLESKSNASDCGIGTETKVLIIDPLLDASAVTTLGPYDACPFINETALPHIREKIALAAGAAVVDEFDIRDANNIRLQPGDEFIKTLGTTMSYFAYRDYPVAGNCQQIYKIQFSSCILPVTWVSFTGHRESNAHVLRWITATEKNNAYFSIERSEDGVHYEVIGTVTGSGTLSSLLSYQFTDEHPPAGTLYYRIKQTDLDRAFAYSAVIALHTIVSDIQLFPNPANGHVTLTILAEEQAYALDIVDMNGKAVYASSGDVIPSVVHVDNLAQGMYLVRLTLESEVVVKKLLVY